MRDDLQAQLVTPVQVLKRQQCRTVVGQGGQSIRRVEHEEPATPVRIARVRLRVGDLGKVRHEGPPAGGNVGTVGTGHGVAQVQQQAGRQLHVLREGTRGPQEEALGRGQPLDRLQQPGLADAGLARQQQQVTVPARTAATRRAATDAGTR